MNYYNGNGAKLVTLEGDEAEFMGFWAAIAKGAAKVGRGIFKGVRSKRRRKRKAKAKKRAAAALRKRKEAERVRLLYLMQAQRTAAKKRKKKELMNIALPAVGVAAAMLLMGKGK
jgi:hypothetical protein